MIVSLDLMITVSAYFEHRISKDTGKLRMGGLKGGDV